MSNHTNTNMPNTEETHTTEDASCSGQFTMVWAGARHLGLICPRCNTTFNSSGLGAKCNHSKKNYLKKIKKKVQKTIHF